MRLTLTVLLTITQLVLTNAQSKIKDVWIRPIGKDEIKINLKELKSNGIIYDFNLKGETTRNQEIEFSEINYLSYRKKNQNIKNGIYGALIGLSAGLLLGKTLESDKLCYERNFADDFCLSNKEKSVISGMSLGILGSIIGITISKHKIRFKLNGDSDKLQRQKNKIKKELF